MEIDHFYAGLAGELEALTRDVPYLIANLANASALLWQRMEDINWAGFYLLQDGALVLGPFQGKPACIVIPLGKGVCGTAAALGQSQLVPDVHTFPGHIACDSASRSEVVVPLFAGNVLWGVLDIDSPTLGRFTREDQAGLEHFARTLEEVLGDLPIDKVGK